MSYLYGDSTPSKLRRNYIEFLRDAVEFCVQVLARGPAHQAGEARRRVRWSTRRRLRRSGCRSSAALVGKSFEGRDAGRGGFGDRALRGGDPQSASDLVRAEAVTHAVRAGGRDRPARRAGRAGARRRREGARGAGHKHDLPDMSVDLHLAIAGGSRYAGRVAPEDRVRPGRGDGPRGPGGPPVRAGDARQSPDGAAGRAGAGDRRLAAQRGEEARAASGEAPRRGVLDGAAAPG